MSFLTSQQKALVDQIGEIVDDVEARMMLGTVGLFSHNEQFGVLEDETLYLSVDEESRSAYKKAGTTPYSGEDVDNAAYLAVPEAVMDDDKTLKTWVKRAVQEAT